MKILFTIIFAFLGFSVVSADVSLGSKALKNSSHLLLGLLGVSLDQQTHLIAFFSSTHLLFFLFFFFFFTFLPFSCPELSPFHSLKLSYLLKMKLILKYLIGMGSPLVLWFTSKKTSVPLFSLFLLCYIFYFSFRAISSFLLGR